MAEEAADNQAGKKKTVEDNFDTTGLLLDYLSHWKWFILSIVVCIGCAYYYIATVIPTYQVSASIFLSEDTQRVQNAMSLDATDPLVAMKNYIDETELEMLKSKNSVIHIVDSLNLSYSYFMEGRFRDIPIYEDNPIVARLDSISLKNLSAPIEIKVENASEGKYNIEINTTFRGVKEEQKLEDVELPQTIEVSHGTLELAQSPVFTQLNGVEKILIRNPRTIAAAISGGLNIEFAKNSTKIVRITLSTDLIKKGVDVVEALISFYNQQIIEDKNRSAIQTEAFILDRLVMISGELKDVENRLQEYRQANNITNIDAQAQMNLTLKSDYESQLAEIDAEMQILNEIERVVSNADVYDLLPSAVKDQALANSIELYNRKASQLMKMLDGVTSENPTATAQKEDLSRDKIKIIQNINMAKDGLRTRRASISGQANKSSGQLSQLPPIDKGLQEIFREQQVKVNIYTFLLQKREEIALQKTMATNTARLIDDPVGYGPVAPNRQMIFALAFLIGLVVPAVIIFLRRIIFPVFKDQEELERLTSIPILGEISKVEKGGSSDEIVVGENVSTPIAELFRLLRNNIGFARGQNDKKVILVTSSISGEGKTFVALNLAMTYALTGKKTCVVGMDIRRPVLARRFGLTNQQGVTTFLSGQIQNVDSLIHQSTQSPNLYIFPAGPVPPNPNELLMSSNMDRLMEQLRHDFDYVIIDSAPIGIISDSYLILRHTDLQLFVTRAAYSTKSCLKVLHQAFNLNKFSSVYIVLNGVNMKSNSYLYRRYGQYGHYGKGSMTYGYGYKSEKESKK